MSDRLSYIGAAEADEINAAFRQLFATSLARANPKVIVQVYRGTDKVGGPVEVLVRPTDRQSREASRGGALEAFLTGGVLKAWAPWDVERGDTVGIGDATATIREVPPVRNGIQSATYEMQDGGGV